jgi:hypothetical protein
MFFQNQLLAHAYSEGDFFIEVQILQLIFTL